VCRPKPYSTSPAARAAYLETVLVVADVAYHEIARLDVSVYQLACAVVKCI
jgi:hypothetical protein